jgi:uncharacterized Zn finger protein
MDRVRRLMIAIGMPEAFPPYVAEIRRTHKRKRNLMTLLDQRGW